MEDTVSSPRQTYATLGTNLDAEPSAGRKRAEPAGEGLRLSEDEVQTRWRDGDEQMFGLVFKRYAGMVKRIAYRLLRDSSEAEDVAQTVFWDVYRARERFDPAKGSLRSWLGRYAYSRALNHKKILQRVADDVDPENAQQAEAPRGLLSQEAAHAVRQALQQLNEDQRITLEMIFLEGMEMDDVAERLGQKRTNVRHHYYRGLKKLRELLGPQALRR